MVGTRFGGAGATALGEAFLTNATITEVSLCSKSRVANLFLLPQCISEFVRTLVSGNSIGEAGGVALAAAFKRNITITDVDLSSSYSRAASFVLAKLVAE